MSITKRHLSKMKARSATVGLGIFMATSRAMAQSNKLQIPFLDDMGCSLLNFFTGSLAIWAFVLVTVGILVIGLIAKIDFAKLISLVVIFGLIQGIGVWLAPMINNAASCIANNGM